jgi:hypothetical protein
MAAVMAISNDLFVAYKGSEVRPKTLLFTEIVNLQQGTSSGAIWPPRSLPSEPQSYTTPRLGKSGRPSRLQVWRVPVAENREEASPGERKRIIRKGVRRGGVEP